MLIRDCRPADVEVLERVNSTGANQWHALRFGNQEAGRSTYLLAFEDDQPVGYCELKWDECPEINGLTVLEPWRGQGIGTALVHACEQRARERGQSRIGLAVADDNPRAAKLYARLGYQPGAQYDGGYTYIDGDGVEHRVVEHYTWMIKEL